jgi:DMSO/TMAO reductase YedYZ molybdopterin-dependent catalytic subunit
METVDGRRAMVVLKKDGKPLPQSQGSMLTYLPGDKYLCRSVKYLDTIEIHVVPGLKERPKEIK